MANIYSAPSLSTMKVSTFKGSDCSVPEDQQKAYRAAKSENMMPYAVGEVGKRPGVQNADYFKTKGYTNPSDYSLVAGYRNVLVLEDFGYYHIALRVKDKVRGYIWMRIFLGDNIDTIPRVFECGDCACIFIRSTEGVAGTYFLSGAVGANEVIIKLQGARIDIFTHKILASGSARKFPYCMAAELSDGRWTQINDVDEWTGTTPEVMQGCNPEVPSGFPHRALNLLNPFVTESFCIKEGVACVFYLNTQAVSTAELLGWGREADSGVSEYARFKGNYVNDLFKVEVLCAIKTEEDEKKGKPVWVERPLHEKDGYNPAENRLYLSPEGNLNAGLTGLGADNMIGVSPVGGEDNVRITFLRSGAYEDFLKIFESTIGASYGVSGYKDRMFFGGAEFGNRVYYSEMDDPLYVPETNYIDVSGAGEIIALDGTTDVLTILTDNGIYLGSASRVDTTDNAGYIRDAVITISNRIPAPPPKNGGKMAILGGEVVYLSTEGVIAVASKENYAARYAEHRSAMIDREMLKDDPLELISLGRFLMIRCANGVWWLLDENQPNSEGDKPYASHQYEGWRLTGMPCDSAFAENGTLYLIKDGIAYRWTDGTQASHFHDEYDGNNTAISAWWEIPWIFGSTIYKNKIFQRLGILLGQIAGADTSVKIEGKKNDEEWSILWHYDRSLCTFGYDKIDYSLFTYSGKPGNPNQSRKIKIKKAKQFKLRFINDYMDQPLILREYGLDYVQES